MWGGGLAGPSRAVEDDRCVNRVHARLYVHVGRRAVFSPGSNELCNAWEVSTRAHGLETEGQQGSIWYGLVGTGLILARYRTLQRVIDLHEE